MDLQKGKILLEKINALYKNMSADPRNISSIERDLMRSYIRQLYEQFLELPVSAAPVSPAAPMAPAPVEAAPAPPKITLRKPETAPPPPAPEPPKQEAAPPPAPVPPKVEPAPEPPKPEPPKLEVAPEPAPAARETPPPPPPTVHSSRATTSHADLEELFAFASARELSEKLSEQPITDIKKAMGLNDRISIVNELFGNDNAAFDASVATLNSLRSFDEARDYLVRNVADQYNWASKDKKTKAKEFIKLVKRRY